MKKSRILTLALMMVTSMMIAGCAALSPGGAGKKVLLRYKLVPNESLRYKTVLHGSGQIEVIRESQPKLKREVDFTQTLSYSQTTIKRASDFSQIRLAYDDIDIKVILDGKEQPRVSANLEASKQLLLDQKISFLKSDLGEIRDVAGFDKIASEFLRKKPLGEERDVAISTGVWRSMSQFIMRSVSQNVRPFPMGMVARGNSWSDEIEQDIPILGKMKSTYSGKLVGFEKVNNKQCVKIKYTHEMKSIPQNGAAFKGFKFNQRIKGKGYQYFSLEGNKTAYLVKTTSEVQSDLRIEREMTKGDGNKELVINIVSMKLSSVTELKD